MVGTARRELRLRAAVLSCFEVPWLGVDAEDAALERLLLEDSVRVVGADDRGYWALDRQLRKEVARSADADELWTARQRVRRQPDDDRQWAIDTCLNRDPVPLRTIGFDRLRALKWALGWLGDAAPDTLSSAEIDNRLAVHAILDPLRELAREPFVGRDAQLAQLLAHRGPLLLHGFGGVGKSALLARYLLTVAETDPRGVVCYLSLEHSGLDFDRPASLVAAIARQLRAQLDPSGQRRVDEVIGDSQDLVRTGDEFAKSSSRSVSPRRTRARLLDLLTTLNATLTTSRCVIALDTLESVQRRGPTALSIVDDVVRSLSRAATVVLAGRAPAPDLGVDQIHLAGLDLGDAIDLLRRLRGEEVLTAAEAEDVVRQVGTTPLCLRLAAGILARSTAADEALRDIALHQGAVAGELYHRLLGHIADEDVRKLAHPGLTVRRVTPGVVRHVLARPCRVQVPDDATARRLFEALAREAMLVEWRAEDTVVHRADVRQLMLRPLAQDNPEAVARIHRAAIRYYRARDGVQDRAEELYHRLMLGQTARALDARWSEAVVPLLIDSFDELPPTSQAYLAARSGTIAVPDEYLAQAEVEVRKSVVRRRAQELIEERDFHGAVQEISRFESSTGRHPAALADLKVQALEFLGDIESAYKVAEATRRRCARTGKVLDFFAFTLHMVRLLDRMQDLSGADEALAAALEQARELPRTEQYRLMLLRLVVARLRIARQQEIERPELVTEALALYEDMPLRTINSVPGLLRDLAAEAGPHSTKLLGTALRVVGLPNRSPDEAQELGEILVRIDSSVPSSIMPSDFVDTGEADDYSTWVEEHTRGDRGVVVGDIVTSYESFVEQPDRDIISGHYQTESDGAYYDTDPGTATR